MTHISSVVQSATATLTITLTLSSSPKHRIIVCLSFERHFIKVSLALTLTNNPLLPYLSMRYSWAIYSTASRIRNMQSDARALCKGDPDDFLIPHFHSACPWISTNSRIVDYFISCRGSLNLLKCEKIPVYSNTC